MSFKVVLTGGIASGKTSVSDQFSKLGITVIDADIIARQIVEPGTKALQAIHNYFGSEVINKDGSLNRTLLRSIVFEDEKELQWLNSLLHPLIRTKMTQLVATSSSPYSISVIPLLFESRQASEYDRVLLVDCPPEIQLKRLMQRDRSSKAQAQTILDSQASRAERLSIADDTIDNSKDLQYIQHQVIKLHKYYLSLANSR